MIYIGARTFYNTAIAEIAIPESVEEIGNGAFWNCEDLTTIRILKSINDGERILFYDDYDGDVEDVYPSLVRILVPMKQLILVIITQFLCGLLLSHF